MNAAWPRVLTAALPVRVIASLVLVCVCATARAQQQAPRPEPASQSPPDSLQQKETEKPKSDAEINTQETAIPFTVRVNLVPVRVVVRDAQGRAITGLKREDFQLFEDGKPQTISTFTVETSTPTKRASDETAKMDLPPADLAKEEPFVVPKRFIALLFDDVHTELQDLLPTKAAANRYLAKLNEPSDRLAVFTISGQNQLDFTDDRAKLRETISLVQPRSIIPASASGAGECPSINYYEADLIENQNDAQANAIATQNALACEFNNDPRQRGAAYALVVATAMRILNAGDEQTRASFRRLKEVLRRMAVLPGQRTIVLVSPGFLIPRQEYDLSDIIDRAARSNVFISTIDDRGLYTPDSMPDISSEVFADPAMAGYDASYRLQGQARQLDVLEYLADGSGGLCFHSNNDLEAGFRAVASAPELSYLLGFSPQNLKYDGKFHGLKVTVQPKGKYVVQARKGFYALKAGPVPGDSAKKEIEEAIFSQEEEHGLPVALHLQYYKGAGADAKLSVLTHVDIARMQFQKAEGRNKNELIIVAALFDRNGNFITGTKKTLDMRLRDDTLQRLNHTGITVKTNFDVKPGAYVVRLVVRDTDAAHLSAENGVIDIPY
jgi:VWFA-related protein